MIDRPSIWPAAATLGVLLLIIGGVNLGGFDPEKWPLDCIAPLNHQPTSARLFHEQDWGGLIAAECQPVRRSYLDDRFEIFGKEAILEYVDVLSGGPVWDMVRDRDGSRWSGSGPIEGWRKGCCKIRAGRFSIATRSRSCSGRRR